jgi:Flp pilus assembly protein TadB
MLAAAAGAYLLFPADEALRRLPRMAEPVAPSPVSPRFRPPAWLTAPLAAAIAAGVAVTRLVDGPAGWIGGALMAVGLVRWFRRLDEEPERQRREQTRRDLPVVADLLVACLHAGRAVNDSLDVVADAWSGPVRDHLRTASAQLQLGGDPETVWRNWGTDPALAPLARAFGRAARSGTSITTTLEHAASELRQVRRWGGQARARSLGVRTAAPLGLCFMPAFIVLGVVPTVIGTFSAAVL